jgi:hypothetical protein
VSVALAAAGAGVDAWQGFSRMSKAFTREDDAAGFEEPAPRAPRAAAAPAVLRVVRVRSAGAGGAPVERVTRILAAGDPAAIEGGCSAASPLGRALLGAAVGDVVEVASPRGSEELEVVSITTA